VVNEQGDVKGYLRVCIEPILPNEKSAPSKPGTIRQSARLNFRKEDFIRRYRRNIATGPSQKSGTNLSDGYSSETGELLMFFLIHACFPDSVGEELDAEFPPHIKKDKEFSFRVTVVETIDVPVHYSDVFCQFK
jgi:hypothetical protein